MDITVTHNINFLNSIMDTPPPWAVELKQMVADLALQGITLMAKAEEKLAELESTMGGMRTSIDGIKADVQSYGDKATADAAEIESLKAAVLAAQSEAGELSSDLSDRFDALIQSAKGTAQIASEIDAKLEQVVAPLPPADGNPSPPADGGGSPDPVDPAAPNPPGNGGV